MTTDRAVAQPPGPEPSLTIGDLARRTGVAATTLRMWETRHGFPRAHRLPSGHRRYGEAEVELVLAVLRRRAAGVALAAAVADVTRDPGPGPAQDGAGTGSVFATLRRLHPHLAAYPLRKRTLTGLAQAMEDECCARAQRPWLFGCFQEERFYRRSQQRWGDLARTAAGAWALAGFDRPDARAAPVEVALPPAAPLRREWSLVCLAPDLPVCLSAWELPGQGGRDDSERVFEAVWSLEPAAVQDSARCLVRSLSALGHDTTAVAEAVDGAGYPPSVELGRATALFTRVLGYVERARYPAPGATQA